MTAKKLTIKGITFPDFGDDDSKKNFRLIFHIGYNDKDGNWWTMPCLVKKDLYCKEG